MQRPEQHITDTLGHALLTSALAPTGWVLRSLNPDYGADYEVEIFENGRTTGNTFKVQLKSSDNPAYSASRDFVSVSLTVPRARYLVNELQVPTVLVQADVAASRLYWTAPQLEPGLYERLAPAAEDSSITIRIPVANDLSQSLDALVSCLARAKAVLVARAVAKTPATDFVAAVGRLDALGASTFDALIFGYYEQGRLIYAGRTRSGFTPALRAQLFKRMRDLEINVCPFANLPEKTAGRWGQGLTKAKMADCRWVQPELVGQFEFAEWTGVNHLRHSKFVGLRSDKLAHEVVREDEERAE